MQASSPISTTAKQESACHRSTVVRDAYHEQKQGFEQVHGVSVRSPRDAVYGNFWGSLPCTIRY